MSEVHHPNTHESPSLEGSAPSIATPAQRQAALDEAFDYRGDVTITTTDGRTIVGYVYDRRSAGANSCVRIMPQDGSPRMNVPYDQIQGLEFTGKDPAAGKSWETWVKKYHEKKARGEAASIESEHVE
ncbi:MAG: hypothetical protein WD042_06120 [Phycisphaeraceae bacterium]